MKRIPSWLRVVGRILSGFLILLLMVLTASALILAAPQEEAASVTQPGLAALAPRSVQEETSLVTLVEQFPVPVLSLMSGSGADFLSASLEQISLPDSQGYGRLLISRWRTADGAEIDLYSIYPANAFDVLSAGDFHFSSVSGPSLFGQTSIRMENGLQIRLHTQTSEGLYAVILPLSEAAGLADLTRSLQLFTYSPTTP